ncbi:MAG TPA: hypothetical protein QGH10_04300, partial [Armatimonadota bacterium]|nr:hypothetical protein [Armatimonadota bacterium]
IPEDNAWDHYLAAFRLLPGHAGAWGKVHTGVGDMPDRAVVEQYLDERRQALSAVREGLGKPCAVILSDDPYAIGEGNGARDVARMFRAEGWLHRERGDHAAAIRSYLDGLVFSADYARTGHRLYWLVSGACEALVLDPIPHLVVRDDIGESDIAELLDGLLALRESRVPPAETLALEYRRTVHEHDRLLAEMRADDGEANAWRSEYGVQDLNAEFAHIRMETDRVMSEAVAMAQRPMWEWPEGSIRITGDTLGEVLVPDVGATWALEPQHAARWNATIIATALALYKARAGTLPKSLDELSPSVLDEVPPDPYTGEPLKYERLDGGSYRLYSVGADREDDGGIGDSEPGERDGDVIFWPPATDSGERP